MKKFDVLLLERMGVRAAGQDEKGAARTHEQSAFSDTAFHEFCESFIQPNEAAFRQNYLENSSVWNTIQYGECELDFVPIADKEFLVLDRETKRICGTFHARPYQENSWVEKTISSILIADEWDVRKILPAVLQKRWTYVYILLNQAVKKFASFFKLKEFLGMLPPNVKIFATTEEMRQYFLNNPSAYLPRKVIAPELETYTALFKDLHDVRIREGIPSDNVFLSICIPTYNRGDYALNAVKIALEAEYDAEIEILVCDNGSTIGTEAYKEIELMKDSRLRYSRSEQNKRYRGNILNCLNRAKGQFVLFFSDEDSLIVGNLETALEHLINLPQDMSACIFSGTGEFGEAHMRKTFEPGIEAVKRAYYTNYLTGCCFNLHCINGTNILEEIELAEDNVYINDYTHCAVCVLLACQFKIMDSDIEVWHFGEQSELDDWGRKNGIILSAMPEKRVRYAEGAVRLVENRLYGRDLKMAFLSRVYHCFDLLSLMYSHKSFKEARETFITMYNWLDIWKLHYQVSLQTLCDLKDKLDDFSEAKAEMDKMFSNWLICKREQRLHKPEENLLPSMRAQVAKYYYSKGLSFEEIDYQKIDEDLEGWVQGFLAKRS